MSEVSISSIDVLTESIQAVDFIAPVQTQYYRLIQNYELHSFVGFTYRCRLCIWYFAEEIIDVWASFMMGSHYYRQTLIFKINCELIASLVEHLVVFFL